MLDFDVRQTRTGLAVTIDPDLAADILTILDTLVDLARVIRGKAEAQAARKKVESERRRGKAVKEFERRALDLLARYGELTASGADNNAARDMCQGEFGLGTLTDVDILLAEARRLTRKTRKRPRADRREAKNHVLEVA